MPVLEAPLYEYLAAELADVVGDRIYPVRGEEGAGLPYVAWSRVSAIREGDHDPFGEHRAWVRARIQFNCWAAEMLTAINVGEAVVAALSGFSGFMGDNDDIRVTADVLLELDAYEEATKLYRRIVDVQFAYAEGVVGS